ncbi:MAG: pyruvate, phosphate dikinase, partial [Rhizobiaceae bacterium]|nr:pyruvate, phosphate dikinase [Rhizobiaceae bacterium]
MTRWVYAFGGGKADGRASLHEKLGGKGANLAEMSSLGLPVPPGMTIVSDACNHFFQHGRTFPDGLKAAVVEGLQRLEDTTGRKFGGKSRPLLLAVRSGSRVSMPGMMDTVLNLGLNDETVGALAEDTDDPRFAWDSYRRFIEMYGGVVMGLGQDVFEEILEDEKARLGRELDPDVTAEEWQGIVARYKEMLADEAGEVFPQDPMAQLWGAVGAIFLSWMNPRAIAYRAMHNIPPDWGTAVTIQAMVFGNLGNSSATGVAFTRNPSTGARELYGEFLVNAQGEDV